MKKYILKQKDSITIKKVILKKKKCATEAIKIRTDLHMPKI